MRSGLVTGGFMRIPIVLLTIGLSAGVAEANDDAALAKDFRNDLEAL